MSVIEQFHLLGPLFFFFTYTHQFTYNYSYSVYFFQFFLLLCFVSGDVIQLDVQFLILYPDGRP